MHFLQCCCVLRHGLMCRLPVTAVPCSAQTAAHVWALRLAIMAVLCLPHACAIWAELQGTASLVTVHLSQTTASVFQPPVVQMTLWQQHLPCPAADFVAPCS